MKRSQCSAVVTPFSIENILRSRKFSEGDDGDEDMQERALDMSTGGQSSSGKFNNFFSCEQPRF